jgi:hypothetical protein
LIRAEIEPLILPEPWREARAREARERRVIADVAEKWTMVKAAVAAKPKPPR